ncbi:MAG: hypothetical protein NUV52_01800 [Candidatus Roizmanbacteria bacterium]|nr:hypothetical protein [Candidatus Roizmanbacteria bacterium]
MVRKLLFFSLVLSVTSGILLLAPPHNPVIIWIGISFVALSVAAFVGLFAPYRYQVYLGAGTLFCLYLQWQRIMSFELVGYALLGILISEVIYQVLRKLW